MKESQRQSTGSRTQRRLHYCVSGFSAPHMTVRPTKVDVCDNILTDPFGEVFRPFGTPDETILVFTEHE